MENQNKNGSGDRYIQKIYNLNRPTYVYGLIDPRDGSLFWVGVTNRPDLRYDQHTWEITKNNPDKQKRIDAIIADNHQPGMVLIEEFKTREEALILEKNLIVFLSGISSISLKNIEHKPDKSWSFKTNFQAARRNEPWDSDQRAVLIHYYKQGVVCELIAKELQRTKNSIYAQLFQLQKSQMLEIRDIDRANVEKAGNNGKYPFRDLSEAIKVEITTLLSMLSSKYGDLKAKHLIQEIIHRKPKDSGNKK